MFKINEKDGVNGSTIQKQSPYAFVVCFEKKFHAGQILAGMNYHGSMNVVSVESAREWLDGVTKYAKRNGYDVIECTVTNVETMEVTTLR